MKGRALIGITIIISLFLAGCSQGQWIKDDFAFSALLQEENAVGDLGEDLVQEVPLPPDLNSIGDLFLYQGRIYFPLTGRRVEASILSGKGQSRGSTSSTFPAMLCANWPNQAFLRPFSNLQESTSAGWPSLRLMKRMMAFTAIGSEPLIGKPARKSKFLPFPQIR